MADNKWIGLGSSAGRVEFGDQPEDEINILAARMGIKTSTPGRTLEAAGTIHSSSSDEGFTTSNWNRNIELLHAGGFVWKKGTGSHAAGIGKSSNPSILYFFFSTADDNSASALYRMVLESGGNLGLGTVSPQGRIHAHDGTGGYLFWSKSGINGSATTIIPNGTGDVTAIMTFNYVIKSSAGSTAAGQGTIFPSGNYDVTVGADTVRFSVSAAGAFTVVRLTGSNTHTVVIDAIWI